MPENTTLKSHSHSVFRLHYHLVLVTKYRRKVLTKPMIESLKNTFSRLCISWDGALTEFSGEDDHVHLLFEGHPNMELAKFVNNLKTVSSRLLRRDYATQLNQFYTKNVLWSGSYCILSTGGAPLEVIKKYIQGQTQPL
jgi:putative transposase